MNHAATEFFFDSVRVPTANLIGEEGKVLRCILSGMNAERIFIAAECIGDAKWFIEKTTAYAKERSVFGRPIGQNQGIQFPIARAYAQMRSSELMMHQAASLFERNELCGAETNMAKMLAAEASWAAAECCVQTHGGFGFAEEFDIERKFRETRLIRWRRSRPERPEGDFGRNYDDTVLGQSSCFVWLNRGKESLVLDLGAERDRGWLERRALRRSFFADAARALRLGEVSGMPPGPAMRPAGSFHWSFAAIRKRIPLAADT